MRFKKSEAIARKAQLIGCNIDDVEKMDAHLAIRDRRLYTLYDVKSHTGLGDCAEILLNQYVHVGILDGPSPRYLCPVHNRDLYVDNNSEGTCLDCAKSYVLDECQQEMVFERTEDPEEWAPSDQNVLIPPPTKRDPPLLRDRSLHIGIVLVVLSAIVGWFFGQLSCINSATEPAYSQVATAPQGNPTEDVRKSALPSFDLASTATATIVQKATITPPA